MACHLFSLGWHVEDINLRLGHSPQSKWLDSYINYLAVNRKKVLKEHYNSSLGDIKAELEKSRQREQAAAQRLSRQAKELVQMRQQLESFKDGQGVLPVLAKLARKQKQMEADLRKLSGKRFGVILPSVPER